MGFVLEVNSKALNDALQTSENVVVDFWSPNCVYCNMMAPAFNDLAEKYLGQVWFLKIRLDENNDVAIKQNIEHLPTFITFKNGIETNRLKGRVPFNQMDDFIRLTFEL